MCSPDASPPEWESSEKVGTVPSNEHMWLHLPEGRTAAEDKSGTGSELGHRDVCRRSSATTPAFRIFFFVFFFCFFLHSEFNQTSFFFATDSL